MANLKKKRTVYVIHVEMNISRSNNFANSDMQVNTVHVRLSIAKSHYVG
jgi:hypothetical protein